MGYMKIVQSKCLWQPQKCRGTVGGRVMMRDHVPDKLSHSPREGPSLSHVILVNLEFHVNLHFIFHVLSI